MHVWERMHGKQGCFAQRAGGAPDRRLLIDHKVCGRDLPLPVLVAIARLALMLQQALACEMADVQGTVLPEPSVTPTMCTCSDENVV